MLGLHHPPAQHRVAGGLGWRWSAGVKEALAVLPHLRTSACQTATAPWHRTEIQTLALQTLALQTLPLRLLPRRPVLFQKESASVAPSPTAGGTPAAPCTDGSASSSLAPVDRSAVAAGPNHLLPSWTSASAARRRLLKEAVRRDAPGDSSPTAGMALLLPGPGPGPLSRRRSCPPGHAAWIVHVPHVSHPIPIVFLFVLFSLLPPCCLETASSGIFVFSTPQLTAFLEPQFRSSLTNFQNCFIHSLPP
ncbi:hypothetical protein ABVT39_001147 [Epinephelus coioides]